MRHKLVLFIFLMLGQAHAATFATFVDDDPGFLAAIGSGTVETLEDFSSVVVSTNMGAPGSPDTWNGFTTEVYGVGSPWSYGASRYCPSLSLSSCIFWNPSTPAVPGIYGSMNPGAGISIKPSSPDIVGISFDFVDWNDVGQRSHLIIEASDGTSTTVTGPANPANYPPQKFGVTLSAADIAAGLYITELRWVGTPANAEVVGFYNVRTYTNPFRSTVVRAVPLGGGSWLVVLAMAAGLMGAWLRLRR